jgi:hypothetical protein
MKMEAKSATAETLNYRTASPKSRAEGLPAVCARLRTQSMIIGILSWIVCAGGAVTMIFAIIGIATKESTEADIALAAGFGLIVMGCCLRGFALLLNFFGEWRGTH